MLTCQQSSSDLNESLWGTAPSSVLHWILVEVPKAWPAKITLDQLAISEVQIQELQDKSKTEGWKILCIRQKSDSESSANVARIFYCDLQSNQISYQYLHQDWSLHQRASWLVATEPMILLCTHGSRDRCCGILGGKLYAQLAQLQPEWVWQSSHLGGHRFAPTLLALPKGEMLGRVENIGVEKILSWVKDQEEIPLQMHRGNVRLSSQEQAIDLWIRSQSGYTATMEWRKLPESNQFQWYNSHKQLCITEVLQENLGEVLASCGDEHLKTVNRWKFVQIT